MVPIGSTVVGMGTGMLYCDIPRFELQHEFDYSDGLEDCEDPECCYSDKCSTSQYCKTVPDPSAVINLNQEPHHSENFFEKYKFLIQEGSLQRFAKLEQFDLR